MCNKCAVKIVSQKNLTANLSSDKSSANSSILYRRISGRGIIASNQILANLKNNKNKK